MTRLEDRQTLAAAINAACAAGARLGLVCAMADIDVRTFQRWQTGEGLTRGDRRPDAVRPVPPHALTRPSVLRGQSLAALVNPKDTKIPMLYDSFKGLGCGIQ